VIAASRVCHAPARHLIFAAGDAPGGIFGVVRGGFGVQITTPDHLPRLAHIYRDGRWFGFGAMAGDAERSISIAAMEDSVYLHMPLLAFQNLLAEDPEAPLRMARLSNEKVDNVMRIACDLMIADTARRIAAVLLRVTAAYDGVEPVDPEGFHITQGDLAEMANASRPYVNKVLNDFADHGWIRKRYNCIRILQLAQLRRMAFDD
jgi:CRP-like cAMP-binding protein